VVIVQYKIVDQICLKGLPGYIVNDFHRSPASKWLTGVSIALWVNTCCIIGWINQYKLIIIGNLEITYFPY
jgi:hypothetical protein